MRIEISLDENGYANSFTIVEEDTAGYIEGSFEVEVEENEESLYYVYDCYKLEGEELVFDKDKLTEIVNQEPPKSREQELEERIAYLEDVIKKLGL